MFCFSAAAKWPGEAASIHWEGVQEIGWNYELLGEPNWIEDMSAQMDAFVTAGIEGIEVVQGRPNILSPLIIHTFPTEWFPAHVMSGICYQPDSPNIHVTGIVFVPWTPCRNWMSQAFSTNPIAPNDVFYSPWKPKVKECRMILYRFSHSTIYFEEFWPTIKKDSTKTSHPRFQHRRGCVFYVWNMFFWRHEAMKMWHIYLAECYFLRAINFILWVLTRILSPRIAALFYRVMAFFRTTNGGSLDKIPNSQPGRGEIQFAWNKIIKRNFYVNRSYELLTDHLLRQQF